MGFDYLFVINSSLIFILATDIDYVILSTINHGFTLTLLSDSSLLPFHLPTLPDSQAHQKAQPLINFVSIHLNLTDPIHLHNPNLKLG